LELGFVDEIMFDEGKPVGGVCKLRSALSLSASSATNSERFIADVKQGEPGRDKDLLQAKTKSF